MNASSLRILFVHNAYQHRGGEDSVVEAEVELMRSRGHIVQTYFRSNHDVGSLSSQTLAQHTLWSPRTTSDLKKLILNFRPDIIHAHNTFPLISPSLYWAAERAAVPVVQTLHNFRTLCLNSMFLYKGQVCEDCLGRLPWRGVGRKCYRGSVAASAVLAGMLSLHRGLGTYRNKVARYIALNDFCRRKFIEGGLPGERIAVKQNFVDFPEMESVSRQGFLFVGRLSMEKGVATLAEAMALLPMTQLSVAGIGPESNLFNSVAGATKLGDQPSEAVRQLMMRASALVVPSIWYENFPRTIVEAFACGLPVIASSIGALKDIVRDGETGLLFEPGNASDLAAKMAWAQANPQHMAEMGREARLHYETEFSADVNYRHLMEIYTGVLAEWRKNVR